MIGNRDEMVCGLLAALPLRTDGCVSPSAYPLIYYTAQIVFFSFGGVRSMELLMWCELMIRSNAIREMDTIWMGYSSNEESATAAAAFHSPFTIPGIRAYAYRISDVNTPDRNILHTHIL